MGKLSPTFLQPELNLSSQAARLFHSIPRVWHLRRCIHPASLKSIAISVQTCSFTALFRQTAPTLIPIDHHFLFTTSRFLCRAQTSKSSRYIDPVDRKAGEIVERGITQEQFPPGDNQAELHFSIRPSYEPFIRSFVHVLGKGRGEGGGGVQVPRKTRKTLSTRHLET